jgi:hypothetical protein
VFLRRDKGFKRVREIGVGWCPGLWWLSHVPRAASDGDFLFDFRFICFCE